MYFIMHVPMQRLIILDLWIPLSGLLWSWYRIHCRRSLCFCVWMIRWYLNLAQNLKMFQNCLTMLHTTVPTIWMDTALWVSCSAYLSGIGIKYLIFPFLLAIVCGRKKNLNWNWQPPWSGRLCLNFAAKIMSSSFVTAGIQNRTWYPSLMNIRIWIWLAMQGLILSCMILHLHRPVVGDVLPNMANAFLLKQILRFPMKRLVIIISVSAGFSLRSLAIGKSLPMSLPQKKNMVQNDCFSVPFSRKICRFSVHGRKKHHWTRPEVTVWNTFHCCYIRYAGILKQATMNRKRSGLFVTIWCEAAKGLKCWSIWLTSVTVPWRFCPIRTNIFLSTVQKAYRSFVLN